MVVVVPVVIVLKSDPGVMGSNVGFRMLSGGEVGSAP